MYTLQSPKSPKSIKTDPSLKAQSSGITSTRNGPITYADTVHRNNVARKLNSPRLTPDAGNNHVLDRQGTYVLTPPIRYSLPPTPRKPWNYGFGGQTPVEVWEAACLRQSQKTAHQQQEEPPTAPLQIHNAVDNSPPRRQEQPLAPIQYKRYPDHSGNRYLKEPLRGLQREVEIRQLPAWRPDHKLYLADLLKVNDEVYYAHLERNKDKNFSVLQERAIFTKVNRINVHTCTNKKILVHEIAEQEAFAATRVWDYDQVEADAIRIRRRLKEDEEHTRTLELARQRIRAEEEQDMKLAMKAEEDRSRKAVEAERALRQKKEEIRLRKQEQEEKELSRQQLETNHLKIREVRRVRKQKDAEIQSSTPRPRKMSTEPYSNNGSRRSNATTGARDVNKQEIDRSKHVDNTTVDKVNQLGSVTPPGPLSSLMVEGHEEHKPSAGAQEFSWGAEVSKKHKAKPGKGSAGRAKLIPKSRRKPMDIENQPQKGVAQVVTSKKRKTPPISEEETDSEDDFVVEDEYCRKKKARISASAVARSGLIKGMK